MIMITIIFSCNLSLFFIIHFMFLFRLQKRSMWHPQVQSFQYMVVRYCARAGSSYLSHNHINSMLYSTTSQKTDVISLNGTKCKCWLTKIISNGSILNSQLLRNGNECFNTKTITPNKTILQTPSKRICNNQRQI